MCNYLINVGKSNQRECLKQGNPFCHIHAPKPESSHTILLELQSKIYRQNDAIQLQQGKIEFMECAKKTDDTTRNCGEIQARKQAKLILELQAKISSQNAIITKLRDYETMPIEIPDINDHVMNTCVKALNTELKKAKDKIEEYAICLSIKNEFIAKQKKAITEYKETILKQESKITKLEETHKDFDDTIISNIASNTAVMHERPNGTEVAISNKDTFIQLDENSKDYTRLIKDLRKAEASTDTLTLYFTNAGGTLTSVLAMSNEVFKQQTARSSSPDRMINSLKESIKTEQQKSRTEQDKNTKLTALYSSKLTEIKDLKEDISSSKTAITALRNQIANTERTKIELLNYSKLDSFIRKVIFDNTGLTRTEYYRADASAFLKLDAEVINPILTSLNLTPNTLVDFYNKTRAIRNNTAHPFVEKRDITIQSIQKLVQMNK